MVSACSKSRNAQVFGLKEEFEGPDPERQATNIPGGICCLSTQGSFWAGPQMQLPTEYVNLSTPRAVWTELATHPNVPPFLSPVTYFSSEQADSCRWLRQHGIVHSVFENNSHLQILPWGYAAFVNVSTLIYLVSTCVSTVFMRLLLLTLWMFVAFALIGYDGVKDVHGTHQN